MSVTAKNLPVDPNCNASNGPPSGFGTKKAVPAGGLSPVNCDRKGSTIINDHVDVLKRDNIVPDPSKKSQGSSRLRRQCGRD